MISKRWVVCAALLSCLVWSVAGCKKEEAASPETAAAPPAADPAPGMKAAEPAAPGAVPDPAAAPDPAAVPDPAAAPDPVGESRGGDKDLVAVGAGGKAKVVAVGGKTIADTPTYKMTLAAPDKVGKGAQATVTLEIVPKPGWKLNKEFPTKLTVAEPAGVKVAKKEQTVADAVSFAEKAGTWSVEFQADSAGAKAFTGQIKFAVCTETSCDPKKEQLAWNVAVSD